MRQPDDPEPEHKCRNCQFLIRRDRDDPSGDCHRRSPLVTGGMMSCVETVWPSVNLDDWCGEFEHRIY